MKKNIGKRILYIICFAFFCLIDQRTKTSQQNLGGFETFRDMIGIIMALLVFSNHKLSSYKKKWAPYAVWAVISLISGTLFLLKGQALFRFFSDRIVISIGFLLWGIILIHTILDLIQTKKLPDFLHKPTFFLWLFTMGLMLIFRPDSLWPFTYMVMFGCFYLTDYDKEERRNLFHGMLEGIILSFFLLQGWCFVFRPYDQVRYVGAYCNCNLNALFYLTVLAAIMTKLLFAYREKKPVLLKIWYWLLAGGVCSFLLLTICRIAYFTAIVLFFVFFFMLWFLTKEKRLFPSFLKNMVIMALCLFIMFPMAFCTARYLPPLFHHPVWLYGEWAEWKVHSWDKWDSEKYTDWDEFYDAALGRLTDLLVPPTAPLGDAQNTQSLSDVAPDPQPGYTESADSAILQKPSGVTDEEWSKYMEMLQEGYAIDYRLINPERPDTALLRKHIYSYYFHHLNLTGHPRDQQGFQLLPYYWIVHAHNIYLQCAMDFGIPVLFLFLCLIAISFLTLLRGIRRKNIFSCSYFLFFLIPCIFGIFEYCWGTSSLTITTLFLLWGHVLRSHSADF